MLEKLRKAVTALGDLAYSVSGTGSRSTKPYEQELIDSVLGTLDAAASDKVRAQLQTPFFVDRTNKRIHTIWFDAQLDELRLEDAEFADCLFKVFMNVNGRRQTGRVTFYKGYIFSVETPKPEKFYRDVKVEVVKVERGKLSESLTGAIDRLEHGRSDDEQA